MLFPSPIHIQRRKTMPCPRALGSDYFLRLGYTEMKQFGFSPIPLSLSSLLSLSLCLQRSEYDPRGLPGTSKPLTYPPYPWQALMWANMALHFSTGGEGAGTLPAPQGCFCKASVQLGCCFQPWLLHHYSFMPVQRSCSSTPPIP